MKDVTMKMSNVMRILLCCALVCVFTAGASALVIEDGTGSDSSEWALLSGINSYSVRINGGGGYGWPHDHANATYPGPAAPPYAGETGYTTFNYRGVSGSTAWVFPSYKRTDFAGDLSAYMDGSVKLTVRTVDFTPINASFARLNNVIFRFEGLVGGAAKRVYFKLFVDPYDAVSARGWNQAAWHDLEVNLNGGAFTAAGSTAPSGTSGSCLAVSTVGNPAPGDMLEFWQNITGVKVEMQVVNQAGGATSYSSWMDVNNLEIIPEPATIVLLSLGGLLLRRKK